MARENEWIGVTIKNKKTGASMTLYHPPMTVVRPPAKGAGQTVDRFLRRTILELPDPADSDISITALPSEGAAALLTAKVPAADVPAHHWSVPREIA